MKNVKPCESFSPASLKMSAPVQRLLHRMPPLSARGLMSCADLFDLERLPQKIGNATARNFGQHTLLARHLVENGAPFVMVANGMPWDCHVFQHEIYQMLVPDLDNIIFQLITDLKDRDMLDNTLVVMMGEFGRTPGSTPVEGEIIIPTPGVWPWQDVAFSEGWSWVPPTPMALRWLKTRSMKGTSLPRSSPHWGLTPIRPTIFQVCPPFIEWKRKPSRFGGAVMKWELEKEIKLPTAALGLSTLPHSESLLVSCFDGSILRVDPRESTWETLGHHQSYASGVVSVLDGSMAVSAGYDGVLQWHHLGSGKTVAVEKIHDFWSWQLKASPMGRLVASVTGQYLCGGERYEPAQEKEPSIKVFDAQTQSMVAQFSHLPPVLSVAFSPDSRFLAAANMMGDVRVWDLKEQRLECSWNTPDFTSWGIIKSHHYIGGIFDVCFSPGGEHLLVCGMGPMRDPWQAMANRLGSVLTGEVRHRKKWARSRTVTEAVD